MTTEDLELEKDKEAHRMALQMALQHAMHQYICYEHASPAIAIQEASRLVGIVMYKICSANEWLKDEPKITEISKRVADEIGSTFKAFAENKTEEIAVVHVDEANTHLH